MALFSIENIGLAGISVAVPRNKESNLDYDRISEKERKLLIKTTGIEERRIAPKGMTTSDLCFEAAEKLIEMLDWHKKEIQIAIFVSQSPDYYLPATAVILQDRLALSTECIAFDINLGCSGYVYGLSVIYSMMASFGLGKGLLMVGDTSSITCSVDDKSTYPIFGDAGSVTAVELNKKSGRTYFNLKSDGSGHQAIIIPDGCGRNYYSEKSFEKEIISNDIKRSGLNIKLNGIDIFNFSVTKVPLLIKELLDYSGTQMDDYHYIIFHQANLLIIETIRKLLGFTPEKVPYSLSKYGNTSSASIPLTIVSKIHDEIMTKPLTILLAGFGVGLSWGAVALKTQMPVCPPVIEI